MDLKNDDGMLDRGKVIAELDGLLAKLPIPSTAICKSATASIRQGIIDLMDEAVDAAFMDGMDF